MCFKVDGIGKITFDSNLPKLYQRGCEIYRQAPPVETKVIYWDPNQRCLWFSLCLADRPVDKSIFISCTGDRVNIMQEIDGAQLDLQPDDLLLQFIKRLASGLNPLSFTDVSCFQGQDGVTRIEVSVYADEQPYTPSSLQNAIINLVKSI